MKGQMSVKDMMIRMNVKEKLKEDKAMNGKLEEGNEVLKNDNNVSGPAGKEDLDDTAGGSTQ